jgi:lysozyme family protein
MARANYVKCLAEVLKHEGGWANHPRDPGGATMRGVIQRNYDRYRDGKGLPRRTVREIENSELQEIYREWFWNEVQGDALPYGFDLVAFDGGVNSGPRRGARWLQIGVGAKADGKVGPKTIEAARRAPVEGIERACAARMSFLRALSHWDAFGRGWSRRVASIEAVGTRMWLAAAEGNRVAKATLQERAQAAPERAKAATRAGGAQAGATGAGGLGAGVSVEGMPEATIAIALVAIVAVIFITMRARRRAQYEADRKAAFEAEAEALT